MLLHVACRTRTSIGAVADHCTLAVREAKDRSLAAFFKRANGRIRATFPRLSLRDIAVSVANPGDWENLAVKPQARVVA